MENWNRKNIHVKGSFVALHINLTASMGASATAGGETENVVGGGGGVDRGKGDKDKRLTNESDSFTLLHLKVTVLEERPVLVAMCESLYREHILSHSLHSREPAARQELLFLVCLLFPICLLSLVCLLFLVCQLFQSAERQCWALDIC